MFPQGAAAHCRRLRGAVSAARWLPSSPDLFVRYSFNWISHSRGTPPCSWSRTQSPLEGTGPHLCLRLLGWDSGDLGGHTCPPARGGDEGGLWAAGLAALEPHSAVDQLPNFGIADQLPGLHSSRLQNGQNDVGLSRRVHEISHIRPQRGAWCRTSVLGLRGRCDVALNSMRNAGLTAVNGPRPRDQLPGGA